MNVQYDPRCSRWRVCRTGGVRLDFVPACRIGAFVNPRAAMDRRFAGERVVREAM
jgi:hypothetical protein